MSDDRCYGNKTTNSVAQVYGVTNPYICPGTESSSGNSRCCGHNGICLSNGICQALNPPVNGTGYYIGSCTDRNFEDREVCDNSCSSLKTQEIVYNKTEGVWHCCGLNAKGELKCSNPSKIKFEAPSPAALKSEYSASSSSFMATASASQTLPSQPTTTVAVPTATSSPASSGGLSTGAQAGIGVGVGIVALAAIVGTVFFLLRRRKRQRLHVEQRGTGPWPAQGGYHVMDHGQVPAFQDPVKSPPNPEQQSAVAELGPHETQPVELMTSTRRVNSTTAELPP
ncbi:uncharacterized protein PV06_06639 [Exophiala oligosperma]|uniref:Uncharacterized protein n=1 Tax=Exophiala oligosperma TaxID=215243 RepID=A0A0D2BUD8_9EURO|nr:uncharacterized protein PV06_06639 [Exophiala oligosperma]KIW41042.1 hypothetical protein PV06_06639 [Exophiala oligosperma]